MLNSYLLEYILLETTDWMAHPIYAHSCVREECSPGCWRLLHYSTLFHWHLMEAHYILLIKFLYTDWGWLLDFMHKFNNFSVPSRAGVDPGVEGTNMIYYTTDWGGWGAQILLFISLARPDCIFLLWFGQGKKTKSQKKKYSQAWRDYILIIY